MRQGKNEEEDAPDNIDSSIRQLEDYIKKTKQKKTNNNHQ